MDEDTLDNELEMSGELQKARASIADGEVSDAAAQNDEAPATDKSISLFNGLLFGTFVFIFFDLPQLGVDFLLGWLFLSPLINWMIAALGWLAIYLWLVGHGESIFWKGKNLGLMAGCAIGDMIPFIPGLAGFVIAKTLRSVAAKNVAKVAGDKIAGTIG